MKAIAPRRNSASSAARGFPRDDRSSNLDLIRQGSTKKNVVPLPVKAQPMEVNDIELAAIRSVISGQLEAFQKDNDSGAFSFASPDIQAQFGTPATFMRMVKTAYQPVYRPRSVMFEDITTIQGIPTQKVLLLNEDGRLVRALYLMQKQPDGTWRIAGCYLVLVEGETI